MSKQPFFVTHEQDDAARRDAIAQRQDIINNFNIEWSKLQKFENNNLPKKVISVKINDKEVPFRVNKNETISII